MKQFAKALLKDNECFKYISRYLEPRFPGLSYYAKLIEGKVGRDIRTFISDKNMMNSVQRKKLGLALLFSNPKVTKL